MHQRLFSYAMLVYAFGFVAALTLNIDVPDEVSQGPAKVAPKVAEAGSLTGAANCAGVPDIHVVSAPDEKTNSNPSVGNSPCTTSAQDLASPVVEPGAITPAAMPALPRDL